MTLEATMLILDNSAHSINGDYTPTRLAAQADAVHIIFNTKLRANPENEVGLMVMGGKAHALTLALVTAVLSPEVLVTPTQDEGKLVAALHELKQGGDADLSTGIQVAQLALKHRQNKNQRQRIIVFVGSPLSESTAALVKLGKKMKKNNVSIDIVSFGTSTDSSLLVPFPLPTPTPSSSTTTDAAETNETKLLALHEAVNASDNSHYLYVDAGGPHLLSDKIHNSPILRADAGNDDGDMGGGGDGGDGYGVDPNLDPELALALRMSLDEERARQTALTSASAPATSSLPAVPETVDPSMVKTEDIPTPAISQPAFAPVEDVEMDDKDEDEDLKRAMALSKGDDVDMDDDEEMARAIALSMQDDPSGKAPEKDAAGKK